MQMNRKQGRAGPGGPGQQSRAGPGQARPGRAGPGRAGRNRARPDRAGPVAAEAATEQIKQQRRSLHRGATIKLSSGRAPVEAPPGRKTDTIISRIHT